MEITEQFYAPIRDAWRDWLQQHQKIKNEIWLVFYKKHTGVDCVSYNDAVEEAICFGWIDSIIKSIDNEKYARKFTPRKKSSRWSRLNIKRAKKMIADNKMTQAGLILLEEIKTDPGKIISEKPAKAELTIPDDLIAALAINKTAQQNFDNFAFSYKRNYVGWICSAKKPETRQRRIKEAVEMIARNVKNLMK